MPELEDQLAAGRAQRLVDAGQHAAQPVGAICREQANPLGLPGGTELLQRPIERLAAQNRGPRVLELAETRIEPRRERMRTQEPAAEAVDGRDPCAVELSREVVTPALVECGSDPAAQLARRLARVRDDEDRLDVDPALAHRSDVALDEHRRLAGAGAGRDEHRAFGLDRSELLVVERARDSRRSVMLSPPGTSARGHTTPGTVALRIVAHVARLNTPRVLGGSLTSRLDLAPERLFVQVVVLREPREVVARLFPQHPTGETTAGQRPVDTTERLDADEVAEREDVERDLEAKLAIDVTGGVRALARFVVLDDPASAERVDVDPVDLPGEPEIVAELEASLQLRRRSLGAEGHLEPSRHERDRRDGFVTQEPLQIRTERVSKLELLSCVSSSRAPDSRASSRLRCMSSIAASRFSGVTRSESSSRGSDA